MNKKSIEKIKQVLVDDNQTYLRPMSGKSLYNLAKRIAEALTPDTDQFDGFENEETKWAWKWLKGEASKFGSLPLSADCIKQALYHSELINLGISAVPANLLNCAYQKINFPQLADRYKKEFGGGK